MKAKTKHTILLGGIGGDSHSVGLTILRQALQQHYNVFYLGTQSKLDEFFSLASLCNVVMISCMDGHAKLYLKDFPAMRQEHHTSKTKWYLGGNLTIGDGLGHEKQFVEMGFNQVFVKFVDIRFVLEMLERDLHQVDPIEDNEILWNELRPKQLALSSNVSDDKLRVEDFYARREEILQSWKTGEDARDLENNALFLKDQPSFPKIQEERNSGKRPILIQPRSGVPLVEDQIHLFRQFKASGANTLSYQVDSLTRNNNYIAAEEEIAHSKLAGATINGFPVINHGVRSLRRIIHETKVPLQTRHSTRLPQLLAEISYAGGVTSFEGGAICYNIPYYKNYSLTESIKNWQYVDRLTGLYYDKFDITLDREYFGTLTATLIPPSLAIVTGILESLLALGQGVKCVSLGYAEQGNRIQDIAAIRAMKSIAEELFGNMGHKEIQINTVFHQYMAAFPGISSKAQELIQESGVTAQLSGATRVITKTPVEAIKIPTVMDNIEGLKLTAKGVFLAHTERPDETAIHEEEEIIKAEVRCIFDSVVFAGKGNLGSGIVKAFEQGLLDIPFAPSIYNKGKVITARDKTGAVRYLNFGGMQLDKDLRTFHQERMTERMNSEAFIPKRDEYLLVEKDVMFIARGQYEHWPLFK